jgi:hypothetical protein
LDQNESQLGLYVAQGWKIIQDMSGSVPGRGQAILVHKENGAINLYPDDFVSYSGEKYQVSSIELSSVSKEIILYLRKPEPEDARFGGFNGLAEVWKRDGVAYLRDRSANAAKASVGVSGKYAEVLKRLAAAWEAAQIAYEASWNAD